MSQFEINLRFTDEFSYCNGESPVSVFTLKIPGFRSGTPLLTDAKPRETITPRFIWQLHRFTMHYAAACKTKNQMALLNPGARYNHSFMHFCILFFFLPISSSISRIRRNTEISNHLYALWEPEVLT